MLTDSQTNKIKDLLDNKRKFISLITDKFDKEDAYDLYEQFDTMFARYYGGLQSDIASRTMYDQALRSHKVSPFMAGGAAQGIAGLGAGIYVASQMAGRNASIDAERERYHDQVLYTSSCLEDAERRLWSITVRLDEFLSSLDEIQEYRKRCM